MPKDQLLPAPYQYFEASNITKKNANKALFFEELGIATTEKTLLVAIMLSGDPDSLAKQEKEALQQLLDGLSHVAYIQPVIVVYAEKQQKKQFQGVTVIAFGADDIFTKKLLASTDAYLFLSDAKKLLQITSKDIQSFGGVIICDKHELADEDLGLSEYNPFSEKGNCLTYATIHAWTIAAVLFRLYEVFRFPYDWNTFRRLIISS